MMRRPDDKPLPVQIGVGSSDQAGGERGCGQGAADALMEQEEQQGHLEAPFRSAGRRNGGHGDRGVHALYLTLRRS